MQNIASWLNPRTMIPAMHSKETAFGLNPLNIGGEADPDRSPGTAPGTTDLKDAREEEARLKREEEARLNEIANTEKEAKKRAKEALLNKRRQGSTGKSGTISAGLLTEEADVKKRTLLG